MKFDCAILNPPYDRNLHLKILEQVITKADKVINISPVRWLQDPFAPYNTRSDYCKFEDSISKKIESLDVILAKDASKLFDASFTMNLGIYTCGQGGYNYQHNDPLVTKIVEKTMAHSWEPYSMKNYYLNNVQDKAYILNVSGINGDVTRIMCKTYIDQCAAELNARNIVFNGGTFGSRFSFDTEEERKNFYTCYIHPFMLWHYSIWKLTPKQPGQKIPYFDDYTHPWDYQEFFAWFDLTKEEQERVMQEIVISEKLNSQRLQEKMEKINEV